MRFEKRITVELPLCYAAGAVTVGGTVRLLFAPDGPGPCYAVDPVTGDRETVWSGPGGTMSLVPLPGTDGDLLAVQGFFPDFKAEGAGIVRVRRGTGGWTVEPFLELPFVHRFGLIEGSGTRYLVAATLCSGKEYVDDWRSPGAVLAGELNDDFSPPALSPVLPALHKNHGFCITDGGKAVLVSGEEGLYELAPPERPGGTWAVRQIFDRPVSDIAVCDIDGDGLDELAAIEPFHGDTFTVYKPRGSAYEPLYRIPEPLPFCHAIRGGALRGGPAFLGGNREGRRELFVLRFRNGEFVKETIEAGKGPSNVCVVPGPAYDLLAVASRETGEGAVFVVTDD